MKKYLVTIDQTITHEIEVEANSYEEAVENITCLVEAYEQHKGTPKGDQIAAMLLGLPKKNNSHS